MAEKILKVAVTGTKGKTTTVHIIAQLLRSYEFARVLHVDTTGHFINGVRRSTLEDSQRTWGLVPSVAPGRYLYELLDRSESESVAAVLETSLGCSTLSGMGYSMHQVGVLLNVFEDHIGSSSRINSKADILEAKKFVVTRTLRGGFAILNLDDPLVASLSTAVPTEREVYPIFFGLKLQKENLPNEHAEAAFVTVRSGMVTHIYRDVETPIVAVRDVIWTFEGEYTPSIYNLLAATAALIGCFNGLIPKDLGKHLAKTTLDRYGGRLTRLKNNEGVQIIADYAHEKKSLVEIARLARKLTKRGGKVIGVVRLAYDRTDELIKETGHAIAPEYDALVVYDKIDGFWKQAKENLQFSRFTQEVGKISGLFSEAISQVNENCVRILREDEAVQHAAALAQPGDVVVVIVNDNIERSIAFIQEAFNARFQ